MFYSLFFLDGTILDVDYLIDNRKSGARLRKASRYVLIPVVEGSTMIYDIDYLTIESRGRDQERLPGMFLCSDSGMI